MNQANITQPDVKDRWMAQSIVTLIARVFWIKAESGVARVAATSKYFKPLRGETIYYIVSCLNWGLREYESGGRRTQRCDAGLEGTRGDYVEGVTCIPCLQLTDEPDL